ncbi:MAG TPA: proton-conducting transporter membrane subunit [bacterium]|nr:proton-conducting transporter membrane subunit [bacterium]
MEIKLLPFFVILPMLGAFVILLLNALIKNEARYTITDILSNVIVFILFVLSLSVWNKTGFYIVGGWRPPIGISLILDRFSGFLLIIVNLVAAASALYSVSYMSRYTARRYYYALFLLMIAGMNGVLLTGDMFNLFVFMEIATISSYALVAFGTEAEELEASFKYMVMGNLAGAFILFGLGLIYSRYGLLHIAQLSSLIVERDPLVKFAFFLFLAGFSVKAAIIPFHAWLPDAHPSAPAPISAMLSGVLIKALGVYVLVRIFFVLFPEPLVRTLFLHLAGISLLAGVLLALGQMDMKRLFAYHSISQVGYIMLGFGLGTPLGVTGAVYHLLNHSLFKSLLFLNSGAVYYRTGTRDLEKLGGLNQVMPFTGASTLIGSFSIAGLPPFNGFFSKFIIILACWQSGHPWFTLIAVLGSVLTLASFLKVEKFAFFGPLRQEWKDVKEVPVFMISSMVFLALLCIATSLLFLPGLREKILLPAAEAALNAEAYRSILP